MLSEKILQQIKLNELHSTPGLVVISIGDNKAHAMYVKRQKSLCCSLGFYFEEVKLSENVSNRELIDCIQELNHNKSVNGILCQNPLPKHLEPTALNEILSSKDVDCISSNSLGKIVTNKNIISPCTPGAVIELLKEYNISLTHKHCVVIGRSNIVGKPLSLMLLNKNATITVCHSYTKNLKEICLTADILISAVGKPNLITEDMIKENSVLIDIGINIDKNNSLCGDISPKTYEKSSFYTPVPGGVGPVTNAILMRNLAVLSTLDENFSFE